MPPTVTVAVGGETDNVPLLTDVTVIAGLVAVTNVQVIFALPALAAVPDVNVVVVAETAFELLLIQLVGVTGAPVLVLTHVIGCVALPVGIKLNAVHVMLVGAAVTVKSAVPEGEPHTALIVTEPDDVPVARPWAEIVAVPVPAAADHVASLVTV